MATILLLLSWLPLPLGSHRDWSTGLLVLLVGLIGGVWGIALLRNGVLKGKALKTVLAMFGLLLAAQLWALVQWLAGLTVDTGATFRQLMLGLAYSLLFLIIVTLFHTRQRLTLLLVVLVGGGTLQAFYGAFMTLSGSEGLLISLGFDHAGVVSGTYANRNHMAGYLEMTLGCGVGLLLALRGRESLRWASLLELLMGPKARLRLALVVMVIALVMTRSRMGNAAFFLSLILVGGMFIWLNPERRRRNALFLASIVLVDMLVISQYFGIEHLRERLLDTRLNDVVVDGRVVAQANEVRDDVFFYTLPLLKEAPLLGQGAGSFEAVFPKFAGQAVRSHFDHAHNDYVQFVAEYGLVGSLPLAVFVLLALRLAFHAMWQRESLYRSGVGGGAAMAIIAIGIHSCADFNLQIPANAATFVTVCAIAVLASLHSHPSRSRHGAGASTALVGRDCGAS